MFHTLEAPTGGKPSDSSTAAELTHPAFLSSLGKPYLKFVVEAVQPALNSEGNENAFDRLMAGARRLGEVCQARMSYLPDAKHSSSPGYTQKDAMYNHIIQDVRKKNGLLFVNKHVADTDGTMLLHRFVEYGKVETKVIFSPSNLHLHNLRRYRTFVYTVHRKSLQIQISSSIQFYTHCTCLQEKQKRNNRSSI